MLDNIDQKLQYELEDFDEENDIILPDTYWGELVYIFYILKNIFKVKDKKSELNKLLVQIRVHRYWMKVNKED